MLQSTERPTLDLSGPALRSSLEALIAGSEGQGGVERYIEGLFQRDGPR